MVEQDEGKGGERTGKLYVNSGENGYIAVSLHMERSCVLLSFRITIENARNLFLLPESPI